MALQLALPATGHSTTCRARGMKTAGGSTTTQLSRSSYTLQRRLSWNGSCAVSLKCRCAKTSSSPGKWKYGKLTRLRSASAVGIATVYNSALGVSAVPNASSLLHLLTGEVVLEAFFHNAVLRDKCLRREVLSVPHHGPQRHRLDEALEERNRRMVGTGQEMWAHACDRCMKVIKGPDGNWCKLFLFIQRLAHQAADLITAGVHDGLRVRHLSCSVHECTEALQSQQARYCYTHRMLCNVCYVKGCSAKVGEGFWTCEQETHRAHELASIARNTALFKLQARHDRAMNPDAAPTPGAGTAVKEKNTVKGSNARSYSNNEQLFVRCCGMVIARATFYGSEGVSGVAVRRIVVLLNDGYSTRAAGIPKGDIPAALSGRFAVVYFLRQQLLLPETFDPHQRYVF
jgi:hypothetical protein